jgi:hypothetical protein
MSPSDGVQQDGCNPGRKMGICSMDEPVTVKQVEVFAGRLLYLISLLGAAVTVAGVFMWQGAWWAVVAAVAFSVMFLSVEAAIVMIRVTRMSHVITANEL